MKKISRNSVKNTKNLSRNSDRRRKIKNFHENKEENIQRMANVVQPDSYVRPHRHFKSPEVFIALWGKAIMIEFDEKGKIVESTIIEPGSETAGVEFKKGEFHSLIALEPDTVLYEVHEGPYEGGADKHYAGWSPEEGSKEAKEYMSKLVEKIEEK